MEQELSTENSLTLLFHPHEAAIVRNVVGMYGAVSDNLSVLRVMPPEFLDDVHLSELSNVLSRLIRYKVQDNVLWGTDNYETTDSIERHEYLSITLTIKEWAMCLHAIGSSVYGCLISEHDFFYTVGFYRVEAKIVLESLHSEIERHVHQLALKEKRKRKTVKKLQKED